MPERETAHPTVQLGNECRLHSVVTVECGNLVSHPIEAIVPWGKRRASSHERQDLVGVLYI